MGGNLRLETQCGWLWGRVRLGGVTADRRFAEGDGRRGMTSGIRESNWGHRSIRDWI